MNHRKEYVQFLFVAKGSLSEIETHLLLARDLGYLSENDYAAIETRRSETIRLLKGLIKSLNWSNGLSIFLVPGYWLLDPVFVE